MPAHPGFSTPTIPMEASVPLNALFPRDSCVTCSDTSPTCPSCDEGYSCQVTVPLDCTECAKSYCALDATTTSSSSSSSSSHSEKSPKTGAIAGGVIGGVALLAIVTYLVWRFCVKPKRQIQFADSKGALNLDHESADGGVSFASRRDQRASTHTTHSIASTVLTRASNIIQIAYIPGVMNRASPSSPGVLVPPVPPIPITVSSASTPNGTSDQHFFVPGDLRDSTYSGFSGISDRASVARTSYAPRSSIASTIYGKNAVIVAPPQTGMRAKPTMVNLKSPGITPPVPDVDFEKYKDAKDKDGNLRPVSIANSTFSVGSTFLNSASAVTTVRPVVVRVENGVKKVQLGGSGSSVKTTDSANEKSAGNASPTAEKPPSTATTAHDSLASTIIEDSPAVDQGPFSDPPGSESESTGLLASVPEEATVAAAATAVTPTTTATAKDAAAPSATSAAASADDDKPRQNSDRGKSPFGDEHATRDE